MKHQHTEEVVVALACQHNNHCPYDWPCTQCPSNFSQWNNTKISTLNTTLRTVKEKPQMKTITTDTKKKVLNNLKYMIKHPEIITTEELSKLKKIISCTTGKYRETVAPLLKRAYQEMKIRDTELWVDTITKEAIVRTYIKYTTVMNLTSNTALLRMKADKLF